MVMLLTNSGIEALPLDSAVFLCCSWYRQDASGGEQGGRL